MDGRESTATSGPNYSPFYVQHRGMGPPGGVPGGGLHAPPAAGYRQQQLDAVSGGYAFHQPPFGAPAHIGQQVYHQNHVEMAQQHGTGTGGSQHMAQHSIGGGGGVGSQHMAQHSGGSGGGGGSQHMAQHSGGGGGSQHMAQHSGGGGGSQHMVQHNAGGGANGGMDIGMGVVAVSGDAKGDQGGEAGQDEQVKKKRGRPRKYKPDGSVTLGLSPSPSTPHSSSPGMGMMVTTPGSGFGSGTGSGGSGSGALTEKRGRGRPPGSGKMQQLASLGKWFLGSVGTGFTPHVIIISAGEDVAARIMSFSQQGPRAICIISATGAVSTATLHQDSDSGAVTYEGRFEILCLSGSYLVVEEGGTRTRSGGLCIALCGPDHRVIGGSVSGVLTAAGTVQVIVGSFMYGGGSKKNKGKADQDVENEEQDGGGGGEDTPTLALPEHPHNMPPHPMSGWPPGLMNQMDPRSSPMYGSGSKQSQTKAEQEMEERNGGGAGGEEPLAMAHPEDDMDPEHNMNMPPPRPMGGWQPGLMRQMDSRSSSIDINSIRE
ncbi:AT-hook motif nuclear-localized protein 9-like [Triticum urartu]|nr:AT-hook motif nuclear-localized protein 9-like [Triticum urartu]